MHPNVALHPDQRFHLRVQSITHEFEFAIRRYEADRPIILEPRQSHTLMEFDVLHLHGLSPRRSSCGLEHDFVVQSQSEFRHTTEIAFQFHSAKDFRAQDIAGRGDE